LLLLALITCQTKEDWPPSRVLEEGWPYVRHDYAVGWMAEEEPLLLYRRAGWEREDFSYADCDSTGFYEMRLGQPTTPALIGETVCMQEGPRTAVLHPNAARFVYAAAVPVDASGPQEFQAIRVYDLVAGQSVRLTNQEFREAACPAWTPDGQRVIATGATQLLGGVDTFGLFVIDPRDLSIRPTGVLLPNAFRCPSWSPTGDHFVTALGGNRIQNGEIVVVDTLTKTQRTIASGYTPVWNPTGEWIAYIRVLQTGDTLDAALRLVHPDGTDDHLLYRAEDIEVYDGTYLSIRAGILTPPLVWSPDGSRLAFSRWFRERGTYLWTITPDGLTMQRMTGGSVG
jgi:Tol biopolymer transport system component